MTPELYAVAPVVSSPALARPISPKRTLSAGAGGSGGGGEGGGGSSSAVVGAESISTSPNRRDSKGIAAQRGNSVTGGEEGVVTEETFVAFSLSLKPMEMISKAY